MSETTSSSVLGSKVPAVRTIGPEAPWTWLAAGWRDLWQAPWISLTYGLIFSLVSALLTAGLWVWDMIQYLPPLAAGFMLVGPMLAVGLYEVSRRLQRGERPTLGGALFVKVAAPVQLAFVGVALMALLLIWMRAAMLLFALFLGTLDLPPPAQLMHTLLFTPEGLGLLVVGTGAGAFFAALVFATSVVSVPMLVERDIDAVTAVVLSFRAVLLNWKPMLLWAALVAVITVCGIVTLYVGLIVAFPLIGHATWHAYRALVGPSERAPGG